MLNRKALLTIAIFGAFVAVGESIHAQAPIDYAVRASAQVQINPAAIFLSWPADPNANGYTIFRKQRDATTWGTGVPLAGNATNYTDTNVTLGGSYEFRLSKNTTNGYGEGCIYTGIAVPLVESRGTVVLIVDITFSLSLSNELARLQQDLLGDGWRVLRHDVPRMAVDPANTNSNVWAARSNEVASLKALIQLDYSADPASVNSVFLLGHVPVPYSGALAPDEHYDHSGAWPADGYYGDISSAWTDSASSYTVAGSKRNWNLQHDGKPDPSFFPSPLQLQVGRVDLANLPSFPQPEPDLLRQYLNKDHSFRHKLITAARRGLIDDHLGLSTSEPFAANGWRNFASFFGATNAIASSDWFGTLATNSYLWGYGCGGGTFTSCSGVGSTTDFATKDPQVVFTMFFGSYFGDWDSSDDFLRAAIATPTYTLTSAWVGRPNWPIHHMGLGETIGFSTRLAQNNDGSLYWPGSFSHSVPIALMGDPTLRMHVVAPPALLVVIQHGSGNVNLSWNPSPDTVLGYHVYRAPTTGGPFSRLNGALVAGTNYTDSVSSPSFYMVRAVKLEVSGSGSYYNASQGIFSQFVPPPVLTISPSGGGAYTISGNGIPGSTNRVQYVPDLSQTTWQNLGSVTSGPSGIFQFLDTNRVPRRFYRSVYP